MAQRRGRRWDRGTVVRRLRPWLLGAGGLALVAVVALVLVMRQGGTSYLIERGQEAEPQVLDESLVETEDDSFEQYQQSSINTQVPSSTEVEDVQVEHLIIDVDGAVEAPGVYELEGESLRVRDAVSAAGGLSSDADTAQVNLAAPVSDGMKLYVPRLGEAAPALSVGGAAGGGITTDGGSAAAESVLVNINTATNEELQRLPGVGAATAEAIIGDREANGPFGSPEDIMRVSGIGVRKFEKMREMICV